MRRMLDTHLPPQHPASCPHTQHRGVRRTPGRKVRQGVLFRSGLEQFGLSIPLRVEITTIKNELILYDFLGFETDANLE